MALNESAKVRRRHDFPGPGSKGADSPGRLGLGIRLHLPSGRASPAAGCAPPSARLRRGGGQYDAHLRAAFCRSAHLGVSRGAAPLSASFRLSCHRTRTLHPDLGRRARLPRLAIRDRASDLLSGRIDERRGHHDLQSRRPNAGSSAATAILALIPVSASPLAIPVHGEIPTSTGWLAIAVIVLGVLFAARAQSTIPPASEFRNDDPFLLPPDAQSRQGRPSPRRGGLALRSRTRRHEQRRAAHGHLPRHQSQWQSSGDHGHRRSRRPRGARLRFDRDPPLPRGKDG